MNNPTAKPKVIQKMSKSKLWQRIKAARLHAKLTQQQVADRLGISAAAVTQWEAKVPERRTTPDVENIKRLSVLLHAPLDWLLSDESEIADDWAPLINTSDKTDNVVHLSSNTRPQFLANMINIEASDDRMVPTIKPGDTVTIDPGQRSPSHGKIYAIGPRDTLARVTINLDGSVSAGFDVEPKTLYPLDPDDIVGRAIYRAGPL